MSWVERETTIYTIEGLPFSDDGKLALVAPDIVRLYVSGYIQPVDIGSWCYTQRRSKTSDRTDPNSTLNLVKENSFRPARRLFISYYLDFLSNHIQMGKSPQSLKTAIGQFQRFVGWCDKNYIEGLDSKVSFVTAVGLFSEYLIDQIRKSQISINTGATLQLVIVNAARYIYSDPYRDLFRGIRKISRSTKAVKVTETPDARKVASAIRVYSQVFHQLSDFALNFEPFPKRLDIDNSYFWFFPTKIPIAGPSNVKRKTNDGSKYKAYDYVNGKIFSVEDLNRRNGYKIDNSLAISRANERVKNANINEYDKHRMLGASMAYQSFMMLLSANTGMSLGQIVSIEWDGNYEVAKDRQGFKLIKNRANGKLVEFYIESGFLSIFKKALRLREYLLKGVSLESYRYLFFRVINGCLRPIGMNLSTDFHQRLKICFEYENKVTTRMWRAHKSNWLLKNSDLSTTSTLLQNTPSTVIKHYAEGSDTEASKELSSFFADYNKILVIKKEIKSTPIAVGQCVDILSPSWRSIATVEPDCKTPEGCLFCDHYRVYADVEDYRKLLSLQFILRQSKFLASSESHFSQILAPVIRRIDSVLEEIEKSNTLSKDEISNIRSSVNDLEELSGYWLHKLSMMDDLEII